MTEGTPAAELAKLRDEFTAPIEIGGQLYWHDLSDVEQVKDHLVIRVCTDLRLGAGGPPKELSKDEIAKRLGWLKLLGECNDAVVSSAAYWVLHLEENYGERLDIGEAGAADGANPEMAPLGEVHRPEDARG